MSPEQVKQLIEQGLDADSVEVTGGDGHFDIRVVGECFVGQSLVQKQKLVYATLNPQITSGEIHAVTIKAYTPDEWQKAQVFQGGSI